MAGTLQELGYELAQKALDQQEAALDDLRTRTGTLLTATALVATFLGARALDGATNRALALSGVGFSIGCIVLCVYVLAPRRSISLAFSGSAARAYFVASNAKLDDAYLTLADWMDYVWRSNQIVIARLDLAFRGGATMLVAAIGVWSSGLAIH
ncbi:MAG TPA: hypothetical protein VF101_17010 [Gaiellaceae bacterium]